MAFEIGINSQKIEYFRRRLLAWRDELTTEPAGTTFDNTQGVHSELMGQAANTTNSSASSQSPQDRKQKLLHKIDDTLHRIKEGTYGKERAF